MRDLHWKQRERERENRSALFVLWWYDCCQCDKQLGINKSKEKKTAIGVKICFLFIIHFLLVIVRLLNYIFSLSRSSFLLIIYSIINEIEEEKTNYLILFEQLTPNVLSVYTFRDDDDGNILHDRSSNLLIRRNFFQWFSYSFASIVVRLTPINEPVSMSCEHHQSLFPSSGMKSSSSPVEHLPCVNVIIISSSVIDRREMNPYRRTRAFFFLRLF